MSNRFCNEDDLVKAYSKKVLLISRQFFLLGGDYDDLYQEGMIGLLNAFRTYNAELGIKFSTYAETCIKNRIKDIIKSIGYSGYFSSEDSEILEKSGKSAEELILENENFLELVNKFKSKLSRFEFDVLKRYLEGYSFTEIAEYFGKDQSSIYNAIARVRHKLSEH